MNKFYLTVYVFATAVFATAVAILGVVFDTEGVISPGGDFCLPTVDYPNLGGASCTAQVNALRPDAMWGGLLTLGILLVVGGLIWLNGQNHSFGVWPFIGGIVGGMLFGAFVLANLSDWLVNREILAGIFWRGFAATVVILIGGLIAFWDRFNQNEVS